MAPRKRRGKGKGARPPARRGSALTRRAKAMVRPRPSASRPPSDAEELTAGMAAPDVTLWDHEGKEWKLRDLRGRNVVLFFYPKDMTSGCTTEACEFNAALPAYDAASTAIVGISPDGAESHQKFRAKHGLGYPLAFDASLKAFEAFGVWKQKHMYGRTYMGVERSSFLIDADGVVRGVWRKVKPEGHAQAVLEAARELEKQRGG
jgi:thioredoxin-dependent peroxiredoxin